MMQITSWGGNPFERRNPYGNFLDVWRVFGGGTEEDQREAYQGCCQAYQKIWGQVKGMYALLGEKDLVFIVTLPGTKEAMKASVSLSKLTGISFTTSPAVTVDEFDKILAKG